MRTFLRLLPLLGALLAPFLPTPAVAQSACPYIVYGAVLTPAQWQFCFQAKNDALGYVPVNKAGDTMLGPLITAPSTTNAAGLNLPQGSAPTTPNNGDLWATSAGLFVRINGVTVGPLAPASGVVAGQIPATQTNDTACSTCVGFVVSAADPGTGGNPNISLPAASPGVVNWTGHQISAGAAVNFSTLASNFTGSITTTVLTVSAVAYGSLHVGDAITGTGVTGGTVITSLGTGTGGTGTYNINNSQSVGSEAMTSTGVLPGNVVAGTTYYVTNDGSFGPNSFHISPTISAAMGGSGQINFTGSPSASATGYPAAALASGAPNKTVVGITIPAGNWEVWADCQFFSAVGQAGVTTVNLLACSVNPTIDAIVLAPANVYGETPGYGNQVFQFANVPTNKVGPINLKLAAPTVYYLVGYCGYGGAAANCQVAGDIQAWRMR